MRSNIFKISQGSVLMLLALQRGKWWGIFGLAIVVVLILISIALADIRWAIVSAMVIFIIIPMSMAFLYIYYALKPNVVFNVLPHTVETTSTGVEITLYEKIEPTPEEGDQGGEGEKEDTENGTAEDKIKEKSTDGLENDETKYRELSKKQYDYSQIGRYELGMNSVIFHLKPEGYMIVPQKAFERQEDFVKMVSIIYSSFASST